MSRDSEVEEIKKSEAEKDDSKGLSEQILCPDLVPNKRRVED